GRPRLRRARPGGAGLRLRLPRCTPPRSLRAGGDIADTGNGKRADGKKPSTRLGCGVLTAI
ncbi:MAG: hypothetical protein UCO57_06510, partial [Gemmiger sp.]|uniref:hypothetical protein n=1 Tax=Gemmiger sp. TaxID=2049027 RepID=UPI002E78857D